MDKVNQELIEECKLLIQSGVEAGNHDWKGHDNADVADAWKTAKKSVEIAKMIEAKEEIDASEKELSDKIEKAVAKRLEDAKKETPVTSKLKEFDGAGSVTIKDMDNQEEMKLAGEYLTLGMQKSVEKLEFSTENLRSFQEKGELLNKVESSKYYQPGQKATTAYTDATGGVTVPTIVDAEIDKLTRTKSPLIDLISPKKGDAKTQINSIGNFTISERANESASYPSIDLSTSKTELEYKQAGGIVGITDLFQLGTSLNIISEITELFSDAEVSLLNKLIITKKGTGTDFSGVWFTSGITAQAAGTTKVKEADLIAMHKAIDSKSKEAPGLAFVLRSSAVADLVAEVDGDSARGNFMRVIGDTNVGRKYYHIATGVRVIINDDTQTDLDGFTADNGANNHAAVLGDWKRFRMYTKQNGRKLSSDSGLGAGFDKSITNLKYETSYKFGIPEQSKSSFVALTGITS